MNDNIQFYRMQFDMITKDENYLRLNIEYSKSKMDEIIELTQTEPQNALELGSGMGLDAIGLNLKGVSVDAIEIVEELNRYANTLQEKYKSDVNFISEDFFRFIPQKKYDLIYYMDGFGVSSNEDQIKLLNNIEDWLDDNGKCLIEVYNPSYWKKVDGIKMKVSDTVNRVYGYDNNLNAFLDTWTSSITNYSYTQILQCYSPEEITNMVEFTNLRIQSMHPGGAMDFEKWEYHKKVSLEECLNYQVILQKR